MFIEDMRGRRDDAVREIIDIEARAGEWLPIPEEFHCGEGIGFDVADASVRANVSFDDYVVTVSMISPVHAVSCHEIFFRHQGFFRRNPPGASLFVDGIQGGLATERCINAAIDTLVGMYTDWKIIDSRKDELMIKVAGFADYADAFRKSEIARIASLKERIRSLSIESGHLKHRLKCGELPETEYVELKGPIHREIVSLIDESRMMDPFQEYFSEEIRDCRCIHDIRSLIESITGLVVTESPGFDERFMSKASM